MLETNYPAINARNGTPVEVVEEWLRENAHRKAGKNKRSKGGDVYFNNISTKDIQKRHLRNKRKEKELQSAIVKYSGKPIKPRSGFDVTDEQFIDIRRTLKARFLAGEVVRVGDYEGLYAPSTMRVIISKIVSDLKDSGFLIVLMQGQDKDVYGWVLENSFNDTFLTEKNAKAVRDRRAPVKEGLSSHDVYHLTVKEIADRLIDGQYVRIDEYTARHSRTVILRMVDLALKNTGMQNDVICINYKLGKRAGWILKQALFGKLEEVEKQ